MESKKKSSWDYIKYVGGLLLALWGAFSIFLDVLGKADTASKLPEYLKLAIIWINRYQDAIKTTLLLGTIIFIIWFLYVLTLVISKLQTRVRWLTDSVQSCSDTIYAVGLLEYLKRIENEVKAATDEYWNAWQNFERSVNTGQWEPDLVGEFHHAADAPAQTFRELKDRINRVFPYNWDRAKKLEERLFPPTPLKLPATEMIQKYQEVWDQNKRIQHEIIAMRSWMQELRNEAEKRIKSRLVDRRHGEEYQEWVAELEKRHPNKLP